MLNKNLYMILPKYLGDYYHYTANVSLNVYIFTGEKLLLS